MRTSLAEKGSEGHSLGEPHNQKLHMLDIDCAFLLL